MTEEQALYIQKLKTEQKCSYPTIARLFHNMYGDTNICSATTDATSVMYYSGSDPTKVQVHKLSEGKLRDNSAYIVDYIFDAEIGIKLCKLAMKTLPETDVSLWSDYADA